MPQTDIGSRKYGMSLEQTYGTDLSAAANGAVTTAASHATGLNLENPMIWLVGVGAVTLGLVAFSSHVRVGKFNASATAG